MQQKHEMDLKYKQDALELEKRRLALQEKQLEMQMKMLEQLAQKKIKWQFLLVFLFIIYWHVLLTNYLT